MRRIYPYIALLYQFVYIPAFSQFLQNHGDQVISIRNGAIITINGEVQNQGNIINNGTLFLSDDWVNRGNYHGDGAIILQSEDVQIFDHNGLDVYQLTLDGGGEKQLLSDLNVTNQLSLIQGILTPVGETKLSLTEAASINEASADAYVNGPLYQTGTGYKWFPVGKNGNYCPLELLDVSGINPQLRGEVVESNPQPANLDDSLHQVSEVRYWDISTISGSYQGSLVKLSVGADENFDDLVGTVVAESSEVGGNFISLGKSETTGDNFDGTVTSEFISTQKILALGITALFSENYTVLVPSAFAPDAINPKDRQLTIFANNIVQQDFLFKIFNRWGKIVYETRSFTEASTSGWNGQNQETGELAQFGVYNYVLHVKYDSGETKQMSGTITLFR